MRRHVEERADRIWLVIDGLYGSGFPGRAATVAPGLVREMIDAVRLRAGSPCPW